MHKLIKILILFLFLLPFAAQVHAATDEKTAEKSTVEVLNERIDGERKLTDAKINAIDEKIDDLHKELERSQDLIYKATKAKVDSLDILIKWSLGIIAISLSLLSTFGIKFLAGLIKHTVKDKTMDAVMNELEKEGIRNLISNKADKAMEPLLIKAQDNIEKINRKLDNLKMKNVSTSEQLPNKIVKVVDEFVELIEDTKIPKDFTADDWYYRGVAEYQKGDYDDAIYSFSKTIELEPKRSNAYSMRGNALANSNNFGEAFNNFNKAINLNPTSAIDYNNRSAMLFRFGEFDRAMKDCDKAIELSPTFAFAYDNRARIFIELKQFDKAIAELDTAIRLNPKLSIAYGTKGRVYIELKQYDKAIVELDKSIELNPKDPNPYNDKGYILTEKHLYKDANENYIKAFNSNPNDIISHENLAENYILLDSYNASLDIARKGLKLKPLKGDEAVLRFIVCIATRLLDIDTTIVNREFDEILTEKFIKYWNFNHMELWLKSVDLSAEKKKFIRDKIKLLKEHLHKPSKSE